jgi:hypothetical protein
MNLSKMVLVLALLCSFVLADQMNMPGKGMCTTMGPDIAQFAMQLSGDNQKMFCGQFNDAQRSTAMQLASQQDAMGKSMMSPDQAVQKVAMDNNIVPSNPQKTPTGCPVK